MNIFTFKIVLHVQCSSKKTLDFPTSFCHDNTQELPSGTLKESFFLPINVYGLTSAINEFYRRGGILCEN